MAGLCKGGNEPPGSLEANLKNIYINNNLCFKARQHLRSLAVVMNDSS